MKKIFVLFTALSFFLSSCTVHEQFVVRTRPRPHIIERIPPPPFASAVWIPGEWFWNGYQARYNWHPGHWVRAHVGHIWVNGFWRTANGGWLWVPGHWRTV